MHPFSTSVLVAFSRVVKECKLQSQSKKRTYKLHCRFEAPDQKDKTANFTETYLGRLNPQEN
ncbi:hypothetical protein STEG23_008552, partial [Scotinomys teguina]